ARKSAAQTNQTASNRTEATTSQAAEPTLPEPASSVKVANNAAAGQNSPDGSLTIYQNDKLVFQSPSQVLKPASKAAVIQPPAAASSKAESRVRLSPQLAAEYLSTRVEPQYPSQAVEKHIQGAVVLDAFVDSHGAVQKVTAVQGNPTLIAAASDAVRQWRFHPFFHNGQAEEFQTRVTVNFKLP